MVQVVSDIAGVDMDVKIEANSKSISSAHIWLETANGATISEADAIMMHIARMNSSSGLLGKNAFECAKIDEWVAWTQSSFAPICGPIIFAILGHTKASDNFVNDVKALKEQCKVIDGYLKGKKWISGDHFSVADIFVGVWMMTAFQVVLDGGFKKAMPNLSAWFDRFTDEPAVIKRFGRIRGCVKALKPSTGAPVAAAKKVVEASKKEDTTPKVVDDYLDLFGDENEEEVAAAKAVAEAAKKAKSGKKEKKPVIAQSLVLFEVKPLDDTTDLDVLAARILAISMDGLYWKTEYKKLPVAYGIFKIVIGVTLEDEKVGVDDL